MVKVLQVDADAVRAAKLESALVSSGYEASRAAGALYALTMLERDAPDVLVCVGEPDDMSAAELLEIARSDSALRRTAVVLVGAAAPSGEPADVALEPNASVTAILAAVQRLRPARNVPRLASGRPRSGHMSGTLEIMTLFDLSVSLSHSRSTGRLYLLFGDREAMLLFHEGRIVHAEYDGAVGLEALLATFGAAEVAADPEFFFRAESSDELARGNVSIDEPTEQLLLKVAVELDHQRAAHLN